MFVGEFLSFTIEFVILADDIPPTLLKLSNIHEFFMKGDFIIVNIHVKSRSLIASYCCHGSFFHSILVHISLK